MKTIRFERSGPIGAIVLANPPFNRLDTQYAVCLRDAVHEASESDIRVLVVRAEGPNFSLGGEVREWPGKDINWFRTFVQDVNLSYRAIEALRVPTVAAVQGLAFGGGFELALACDFILLADDAVMCCVEVTTGMLPIAGALQRLADRVLGEPISATQALKLGLAMEIVPGNELEMATKKFAGRLAQGPTRSYAATRTLLKAWSSGGVAGADAMMLDITMDLFHTEDVTRGFASTAAAFDADIEPPALEFEGK
jgi:enoyl-CoA hydratase/carnithine racemase